MLIFKLNPGGKTILASSLEDFAEKYRQGSLRPEADLAAFMEACAARASKVHIKLATTNPTEFVLSLLAAGMVTLQAKGAQQ